MKQEFSGFEDDTWDERYLKPCNDPRHQPPSMMVIPPGKRYRHVCPACGLVVIIRSPEIRCYIIRD